MLRPQHLARLHPVRRALPALSPTFLRTFSSTEPEAPKPPAQDKPSLFKKLTSFFSKPDEAAEAVRKEKREILLERMRRSVFYDAKQSSTEKLLVADARPLLGSEAIDFPQVTLSHAGDGREVDAASLFRGKVTLVTMSFQAHGKQQSDTWHAPFMSAFHLTSTSPVQNVQIVDIVYLEGLRWSAFKSMLVKSTYAAAALDMAPHTYVRFETSIPATEMFCHQLKIHNRMMGYAYLVDWTGKVRWRAHHIPHEDEIPALITCASNLLKGLEK